MGIRLEQTPHADARTRWLQPPRIWLVSVAFDTPWRYVVWAIAQVLELSLPPLSTQLHRRIPISASHLPERWALFTLIVLGESVVAVAIAISGANWHFSSAASAVLGFAAVAAVWWLYFDRQASVVLRGSTMSFVVYSYARISLLMGLAAISAGVRLLIERAGTDHLGTGPSVALLGGVLLYLAGLVGTRSVVVHGQHRLGISLKLGGAAIIFGLLAAETGSRRWLLRWVWQESSRPSSTSSEPCSDRCTHQGDGAAPDRVVADEEPDHLGRTSAGSRPRALGDYRR